MKSSFKSRNGILTLTILISLGAVLALLNAVVTQGLSARTIAASLLSLSFVIFLLGGVLYAGRAFLKWHGAETAAYLHWERGFVIVAVLAAVLGLALLEDMLRAAGEPVLSRLGLVAYLFGAVLVVAAETAFLDSRNFVYPQIVLYVLLAFLAQVAFGVSLLQTGLVPGWVGWVTVIWNLGWLLVMLIVRPRDIYFPVLHHVAPLIIGIALLLQK